ncbi:MAG: carbon storage regulator [Thermoleophilaceae bacterium]|nr:carbon storage regulator [Thermoleophilaceae bacterium]
MIGHDVEVSVLAVSGDKVRLGISAPRSVPVFRKEIYVEVNDDPAGEAGVAKAPESAEVPDRAEPGADD